jgi:hypothetical protein
MVRHDGSVPDMARNLRVKVPYEPLARGIIS